VKLAEEEGAFANLKGELMKHKYQWSVVVLFAVAMAWVESAVVVYLRTLVNRLNPYQANPLPMSAGLGEIELVREAATLIMLMLVGVLAGKTRTNRLAYAAIAFGVWDIFYYIFLVPMSGWPKSIFDWDILFLLPVPWWGPVIAPTSIAALMVIGGTLFTLHSTDKAALAPRQFTWGLACTGVLLSFYAFMADAIRVASQGAGAIRMVLPTTFHWGLFLLAWALLAAPIADYGWQAISNRQTPVTERQQRQGQQNAT
jgi:hypothetical protein